MSLTISKKIASGGALAGLLLLSFNPAVAAPTGQEIYSSGVDGVPACITCHGAKGEGMAAANFPFLAGHSVEYLDEQLKMFADGSRANPVMKPIAGGLNEANTKAVIDYITTLPVNIDTKAVAAQANTYPDPKDQGAWLANRGDWANNIPACVQCHASGGIGVEPSFPQIAGLSKGYIVEQFNNWRDGTRAAGPLNLMGDIAKRMNDEQIAAVAEYFANIAESSQASTGAK